MSYLEELSRIAASYEAQIIYDAPVKSVYFTPEELHSLTHLTATVDDIIPKEAIVNIINKKENNMNDMTYTPVKNVLFLAPGYKYAMTVVDNQSKELDRKKIPYNVSKDPKNLYIHTDRVHVEIIYSDPIKWTPDMFRHRDAFFGKKELIDEARETFLQFVIRKPDMPLSKYIRDHHIPEDVETIKPRETYIPEIKNAYFNNPMTVVMWEDGTKTMVRCQDGDVYSPETGLALCIAKKALGNMPNFNNVFKKWIPDPEAEKKSVNTAASELDRIDANAKDIAKGVMAKFKEALHGMP